VEIAIVGGGPAGLRAAEVIASQAPAGAGRIRLYDGKPSVGRKFLIAGKGGLNLTHSEELEKFSARYSGSHPEGLWTSLLTDFQNTDLRAWAEELGIVTFIGTSGRVFPKEFKAAPLLRRWVERLRSLHIEFQMSHQLQGISFRDDRFHLTFDHQGELIAVEADAVILALGGASWPETGSDGKWTSFLQDLGIQVVPLASANCGWEINWNTDILKECDGLPLKNILVSAGEKTIAGELLITRYGLEGGALYQLGHALRRMEQPMLTLDLKPSFSAEELANKIQHSSTDYLSADIASWKLSRAATSLLKHYASHNASSDPLRLAIAAKSLTIPLIGPRPIAEAISSAGGIHFSELDEHLMVTSLPGLFIAGEMLDWEAPTGGYLLQGCFATGTRAAKGVLCFLENLQQREKIP